MGVEQALYLHLAVEEGVCLDQGEGEGRSPDTARTIPFRPLAPAELGAARLDHLLPARGVDEDLWLPQPLYVVEGLPLASSQVPPRHRKQLRRRHFGHGWRPEQDGVTLFNPAAVPVTRYRYRGTNIPTPWDEWMAVEVGSPT